MVSWDRGVLGSPAEALWRPQLPPLGEQAEGAPGAQPSDAGFWSLLALWAPQGTLVPVPWWVGKWLEKSSPSHFFHLIKIFPSDFQVPGLMVSTGDVIEQTDMFISLRCSIKLPSEFGHFFFY